MLSLTLLAFLSTSCNSPNKEDKPKKAIKKASKASKTPYDNAPLAEVGFNYDGANHSFQDKEIQEVLVMPMLREEVKGHPAYINLGVFNMQKGNPRGDNAQDTDIGLSMYCRQSDTLQVADLVTESFTLTLSKHLSLSFRKDLLVRITEFTQLDMSHYLVSGTFSGQYVPQPKEIEYLNVLDSFDDKKSVQKNNAKQRAAIRNANHVITNGYFRNVRFAQSIKRQQMSDFMKKADKK